MLGSLRGDYIRRALNLTSWEAASDLILKWDASGTIGDLKPAVPTTAEAVEKFLADAAARKLSVSTIQKQKNVLQKRLLPWAEKHGCRLLRSLDVDAVRRFRATWPDAPITVHLGGDDSSFNGAGKVTDGHASGARRKIVDCRGTIARACVPHDLMAFLSDAVADSAGPESDASPPGR